jgi:hypothetical protein
VLYASLCSSYKTSIISTVDTIDLKNMTQRVDLSTLLDYVAHVQLCLLINALREKKKIVVIEGAGISASTGSK